ncbi:MAG: acylphosphatase [Terriglobia bacterium]
MTQTRARVFAKGVVQGVYFRSFVADEAGALGLTGWVRNTNDGRVELVAEGEIEAVQHLIEACRSGPPAARVSSVDIEWEPATGQYEAFSVRW